MKKNQAHIPSPSLSLTPPRRATFSPSADEERSLDAQPAHAVETQPGFGHDFGRVQVYAEGKAAEPGKQPCSLAVSAPRMCPFGGACHACPARVQTKLAISQPGDQYEQEADRVAEQVMDNPGSLIVESHPGTPVLSRQAATPAGEKEETIALTPSEGAKVLAQGEKWIGTPYKYGGDSEKGIDCSHFVHRAYSNAGFDYDYLDTGGFPKSPNFSPIAAPLIGDVILFGGHMGIHNPAPPQSGMTLLSARSSTGVSYGMPSWFGTVKGYYHYKRADQLQGKLQKKSIDGNRPSSGLVPSIVNEVLHSPGQPLDTTTRSFMEPRFGHDFSQVRVHTDAKAAESAQAVNALAYTVGQDVVFGVGQYAPETAEGRKLLAHELTHVVQQQTGVACLRRQEKDKDGQSAAKLTINGIIAAGGELSATTIQAVNEAAKKVPKVWRRFVAYETVVKVGGSLAWRANNPGNLRDAPTKIAKVPGATGSFAVFATMEDGRAAQKSLYLNKYGDKRVRDAVSKLTPSSENDLAAYLEELKKAGINLDNTVKSQIDTLMPAIKKNEGMIEGILVARDERKWSPLGDFPFSPFV